MICRRWDEGQISQMTIALATAIAARPVQAPTNTYLVRFHGPRSDTEKRISMKLHREVVNAKTNCRPMPEVNTFTISNIYLDTGSLSVIMIY